MTTADALSCDVVLRDGATLSLRPAGPADGPAVQAFLERLSGESQYRRFLGIPHITAETVARLTICDARQLALIGERSGTVVALANLVCPPDSADRAEVAFAVADAEQGRGIGTRLLEQLARQAGPRGIRAFDAYVLGSNRQMLEVFLDSGFEVRQALDSGVYHVTLSLDQTPRLHERQAQRAQQAAVASIRPFFEPRTVAVIGASTAPGKIGAEVLRNLIGCGFTGRIVPIHPTATAVQGLPACRSVVDVPDQIDLAIITVPADRVLAVVDDCLAKGVHSLCVISAGFGEADAAGREREAALLARVRAAGCRLVGPNCMGLLNTDPAFNLNATFSPVYPPAGAVAMSTQSGALGFAILDYARRLNVGISSFVSVGNKADVSGNDLLQYWADDPRTSVILMYLESFGNPKKFSEIARRVARHKPIAAVKSGRSRAGARAASSHTGALATPDVLVDALFRQAGVIRTDTLEELFHVAALLSHQPVPAGRRVAVLTNAGGPGILAADACEAHGLTLADLGEATRRELRAFLPSSASIGNPVDMLASAPPDHFRRAMSLLLRDDAVDSVLVIYIPPLVTRPDEIAAAVAASVREAPGKTVLGVFMRAAGAPAALEAIPCFEFPESAAIALARVSAYGEWKATPTGVVPEFADIDAGALRTIADEAMLRGAGWLTASDVRRLLAALGIAAPDSRVAGTPDEAAAAASAVGWPVAVKALGPDLVHKTEHRGVALGLVDAGSVRAACADMQQRLGPALVEFLVQRMVPDGVDMLVGATSDPDFGPVVMCGTGGILVDLIADTSVRLHPLTDREAAGMVAELRGAKLLRGYRGAPPADEPALVQTLLRVSSLLTLCPEIQELDINPLRVAAHGVTALDVRVRVGPGNVSRRSRRVEY